MGSGYDSGHNSFDLHFLFRWNRGADPRFVERRFGIDASAAWAAKPGLSAKSKHSCQFAERSGFANNAGPFGFIPGSDLRWAGEDERHQGQATQTQKDEGSECIA